jgi:uncharacterized OB-fold protein
MAGVMPVAADLLEFVPDGVRLVAGRRRTDGKFAFPLPRGPAAAAYERVTLDRIGLLWSWTIQRFCPKSPPYAVGDAESFRPFAIGYVEIPGQIIVEARLLADFDALHLGMRMVLDVLPLWTQEDGSKTISYAFRPCEWAEVHA